MPEIVLKPRNGGMEIYIDGKSVGKAYLRTGGEYAGTIEEKKGILGFDILPIGKIFEPGRIKVAKMEAWIDNTKTSGMALEDLVKRLPGGVAEVHGNYTIVRWH